jgi:Family of unknown function (DUF695)
MNFLKKLFNLKKDTPITTYKEFWDWFQNNEKTFFRTVKNLKNVDEECLSLVVEKLQNLNPQFYAQVGMENDSTADLVLTAEGDIKTFVFVEDLVAAAPKIEGWTFTTLKPASGFGVSIDMNDYSFDDNTISFFTKDHPEYPDEIDITLVHKAYNENNKKTLTQGALIYLDTILGEYNAATLIDGVSVNGINTKNKDLIPIKKLPDFLKWREKEFIEKDRGLRTGDEEDTFSTYEAETKEGLPIIAVMNQGLLDWDAKSSHPWMMVIEFSFKSENNGGMPDKTTYALMDEFDDKLSELLKPKEGYLNIGRQTGDNKRTLYFACKEFRKSSKTTFHLIEKYKNQLDMTYDIYKDKYWMTLNRFM